MRTLVLKAVVVALAAAVTAAPAAASAGAAAPTGNLLDATPVAHLTADQLKAVLAEIPWPSTHVRYGVTGFRLRYRTTGADHRPTVASGLVVVPDGGPARLPVAMWEHGTRAYRDGVASITAGNGDREAAELFASAGYLAVAPDYLGLGTGEGQHPYMDTATEVSASVDLLRAAASFTGRSDGTVRVTGFSQGGTATMAMAHAVPGITALAPISGPYDLSGTELPALIDRPGDGPGQIDPKEGVFYIAYWTVAMNRLHHLYGHPSEVFQAPYDRTVEALFDGSHDEDTIAAALPDAPAHLLTPQYMARLRHPTGALRAAVASGDGVCRQYIATPVRLFAADGDRDVPIANARVCLAQLHGPREHGRATLVDVGDTDHIGSAIRSVPLVLDWLLTQDR